MIYIVCGAYHTLHSKNAPSENSPHDYNIKIYSPIIFAKYLNFHTTRTRTRSNTYNSYAHAFVYYILFYIKINCGEYDDNFIALAYVHLCVCVFVCLLLVCFNVAIFLFFFLKKTALDCYYYCCCWSCCRCCTSSSIFFIFYSTFLSHELFEFVGAGAQTCTILLHTQLAYVQTL